MHTLCYIISPLSKSRILKNHSNYYGQRVTLAAKNIIYIYLKTKFSCNTQNEGLEYLN